MDFITQPDKLTGLIDQYENWTYLILFLVLFCETGLVIMPPLLPGDTLLFAAGTLANDNILDIKFLFPMMCAAVILGDSVNYWVGRFVGPKVFHKDSARFLNKEQLHRAHSFYEKHGGKTVSIARFIPVIRQFAPFVAGIGAMNYGRFLFFSVVGTLAWMTIFVLGGYFFGKMPIVKENFAPVCMVIIAFCCAMIVSGAIRQLLRNRRAAKADKQA